MGNTNIKDEEDANVNEEEPTTYFKRGKISEVHKKLGGKNRIREKADTGKSREELEKYDKYN